MSLKWKFHLNGNVTKMEMLKMEMSLKWKCHLNGNVTKTELSQNN